MRMFGIYFMAGRPSIEVFFLFSAYLYHCYSFVQMLNLHKQEWIVAVWTIKKMTSRSEIISNTHPLFCWANPSGTSMLCEALRRSPAMSANLAKSVSRSWSAKRADLLDSRRRTSSRRFFSSRWAWKKWKKGHKSKVNFMKWLEDGNVWPKIKDYWVIADRFFNKVAVSPLNVVG